MKPFDSLSSDRTGSPSVSPSVPPQTGWQGSDRGAGSSGRPTFREEIARAARQIGAEAFPRLDKELAYELCAIMAEVRLMRPSFSVKVGGDALEVGLVQEIFDELTHEHVAAVIHRFNACDYPIRNKKAYLRTALYNAVFEREAAERNEVNCELSPYGGKGLPSETWDTVMKKLADKL